MSRATQCEYTEYWVTVDLKAGEREKLEANEETMEYCNCLTDDQFISGETEGEQEHLVDLINEVLENG